MDDCDLFTELLSVTAPWRIISVHCDSDKRQIDVHLDHVQDPVLRCHECGEPCKIENWLERSWLCPQTGGWKTISHASMPVGACRKRDHGRSEGEPAWLTRDPEKDLREPAWLLARHLEVFIPTPKIRDKEKQLHDFLNLLLNGHDILLPKRTDEELPPNCPPAAKDLIQKHTHWENLVFGYSTYLTDGYFLDVPNPRRDQESCLREQTIVLKFIITNYRTRVQPRSGRIFSLELKPSNTADSLVDSKRQTELLCAELHYIDTCDHIVQGIARWTLHEETEIWSQEWFTVLNRWKWRARRDPIVESPTDRNSRFDPTKRVLCVEDYCVSVAKYHEFRSRAAGAS